MPDTAPLVRIELSHPETDDPTWLQEWDGTHLTTSFHPDAAPDAGNIEDWGGYAFNGEWEDLFSKWDPQEVANEIVDLQLGAGFSARNLSSVER